MMSIMLEEQAIDDLRMRVVVASLLIEMLRQDDDPRAAGAIEVLQEQQRQINEVLVCRIRKERAARGESEPEDVVIGLRPVALAGRALRG